MSVRGRHWIGINNGSGEVLRSSDTVYTDIGGQYSPWLIRTHDIKGTAIPRSKLNQITVTFLCVQPNGGVKFELSDSGWLSTAAANHTFPFTAGTLTMVQRQWQPAVRRSSTGLGYSLQLSSLDPGEGGGQNTIDVTPTAVSVDMIKLRGTYTPTAAERA
jgi:hypothetical protein